MPENANKSLFTIFFTVFLDLVGLGIVIPILAPLFLNMQGGIFPIGTALSDRTILLGFLIASYPIAQFFGAPILGALSDKHGRKKILLISLAGTLVGYLLTAIGILTNHLPLLFISRMLDGFTGGNISIAMSSIADLSDEKTKVKNFGLIGMAFGLGFILGPYLGGKLSDSTIVSWFSYTTPYFFAALLSLVNILLVILRFKETLVTKISTKISFMTGFKNLGKAFSFPNLRTMFLVMFLLSFGFNFFTTFFQVYLIEKFNFTPSMIGDFFGYMGLWIALAQGGLTRPLSKRFKPEQVFSVSALLLSITLPMLLFPKLPFYLFIIMPFISVSNGLTQPNATAIVSNLSGKESQGEILGINQSIQSIGQAIPPIISGFIITLHRSLPILVAGITVFMAWLVFIVFFRNRNKMLFTEV